MTVVSAPPPWNLGELRSISPAAIIRDENDSVGRLVLRLALAFNDLKGMVMFEQYARCFMPEDSTAVTAEGGQYAGLRTQVLRMIAGIISEALVAIHDESAAVATSEFSSLLKTLPPATQSVWRDILDEASNSPKPTNSTIRAMLARLRNKSAFHYDGDRLRDAYAKFFASSVPAYYSTGVDMDATRYYFADAAAQQDLFDAGIERGRIADKEISELANKVNEAFAAFINAFLRARSNG